MNVDYSENLQFFDLDFGVLLGGGFFFSFNIKREGLLILRPCSNVTENLAEYFGTAV